MTCQGVPRFLAILAIAILPLCAHAQDREGPSAASAARAVELAAMRSLHVLARARRLDDGRAVRCLDPRVSELTAVYRQATERAERVRRAEATGDEELAARETAIVVRLHERARTLEANVLECVGTERERQADWTETDVRRVPEPRERVAHRRTRRSRDRR